MRYTVIVETFPRDIRLYVAPDGKVPFSQWLNALRDPKARAKIRVRLDRVRLGNFGDHRAVGEGLWELRIAYGPGYRVYFGQVGPRIVVLLGGGVKATQDRDIRQAQACWADHRSRGDGEDEALPG